MKRFPTGLLLASLLFTSPFVRAEESAQQLAEENGVAIQSGDNEESAAQLESSEGAAISTRDNEESAAQLANEQGDDIKPGDNEESAEQLAAQEGGAIQPGDNEESAAALAEGESLEEKPKVTVSGATGSVYTGGEGVNGTIYALVSQSDGKMVIGGHFNNVNGQPRSNLARLNADGTLDTTFVQDEENGVDGTVYALALDPKGNILVGGYFSQPKNSELKNFIRYTPAGQIDPTFDKGQTPNGPVYAIAVQPGGQVVIGGEFSEIGGTERRNIAQFAPNTSLEGGMSFSGPAGTIRALAVLPSGAVTAGGAFDVSDSSVRNILTTPAN